MAPRGSYPYQKRASRAPSKPEVAWARIRDEFEDLHMKKNWTLRKVRAHMKEQRGFDATERQYKDQKKIWGFQKYKTSKKSHLGPDDAAQSDEPSSTMSSEVDVDDETFTTGPSDAANTENDPRRQLMGTTQEQLVMNGHTFPQNIHSISAPEMSTSITAPSSCSSANISHTVSHHSDLSLMPSHLPEKSWSDGVNEAIMNPRPQIFGVSSSDFATSYGQLEDIGVFSTYQAPSTPPPAFISSQQQHEIEDSLRTIGSTPMSMYGILYESNPTELQ